MNPYEFFDLLIELGHHLEQSKLRPRDVVLNEGDRAELEWYRSLSFNKKNADAGIPQIGGNTSQKLHELWCDKRRMDVLERCRDIDVLLVEGRSTYIVTWPVEATFNTLQEAEAATLRDALGSGD
jgi:hypothetical protein